MPVEMKNKNLDPIFVDERDSNGWTPLMVAATHGHLAMCQTLVQRSADITAKKKFKCSALHLAARNGHTSVVEYLVESKANVMARKLDQSTPLHDACSGGHVDTAQALLALMERMMERVAVLKMATDSGWTPLHVASRRGHPEMVKWLVSMGASQTLKDEAAKTPQDLAPDRRTLIAFSGHVDPVDVSMQTVGVMPLDVDEMRSLNLDANGKVITQNSPPRSRRGRSPSKLNATVQDSAVARPMTGDVGTFTSSLGILHDGVCPHVGLLFSWRLSLPRLTLYMYSMHTPPQHTHRLCVRAASPSQVWERTSLGETRANESR